ncbi:MAG TPA: glycosyltransferase [Vicinamibacterales bacterium]|nr:glycosyltransferase [Vicinamibacterales bacterium]
MVIAHVLSSFGRGGQERVAADLARLQRAAGHEVFAISIAPGPEGLTAATFRATGVLPETIAKRRRVDPSLPLRLAAHLGRHGVHVVHTHNPHALIYGAPAAWFAGAVVIHSKHGMNPDRQRRLWLRRAAAKLVDAYVAVSPSLAKKAIEQGDCESSRLHVIPNGIDVVRFAPSHRERRKIRDELGIPNDAWVVGTVGRLAPEKDQALLIDAMAPLLGEGRRLVIVGDGAERDALRTRIATIPGGRYVHMLGEREDVESILAAFDAFALTSRTEGLPLVLLEAMATGLPVLSTAVGGIPDLLAHGVTGFLSRAGDHAALTCRLASLSMDGSLSRQIGEAGRTAILQRYSVDRMAREYGVLYERTLRNNHRLRKPFSMTRNEPGIRLLSAPKGAVCAQSSGDRDGKNNRRDSTRVLVP